MKEMTSKRWSDPKYRKRIVRGTRKACSSNSFSVKCSQSMKSLWSKPEFRKRATESAEKLWKDPKFRRERTQFAKRSWKTRQKVMSNGLQKLWKDPIRSLELKKKIKEAESKLEVKNKLSKKSKKLWKSREYKDKFWKSTAHLRTSLKEIQEFCHPLEVICKNFEGRFSRLHLQCPKCKLKWTTYWDTLRGHPNRCPRCQPRNQSVAEIEARKAIESETGWKFPPKTPTWLAPMHLDGYNQKHKVAFEYQGEQHYLPIYGVEALATIKRNDQRKWLRCIRRKVLLIRVPYWTRDVVKLIRKRLALHGN